jgi:signal transduction histidine kinase
MEGLIDGVIPEDPETYQLVHREASRLSRLVTDLERLSRVEAGVESVESLPLDPAVSVREAVERLRPQFEGKGLGLETEIGHELPMVLGDEDKLMQILVNLLGNSFQYTPTGGRVVVRVRAEKVAVRFEIADTGIGIPPEDLPHIFERFYRVDKSRSAAGGGAGIGLAIAKGLVERMGGAIRAESGPGNGTKISFLLRRADGKP